MKPLCFVLMPFGIKKDSQGREVDFNDIYDSMIKKAIEACDLEPIRADEELLGGTIHKPMYERLVLCEYAIADLTSLNANVFYELGLRHAIKPHTTIPIFAFDADLPFDLKMQRTLPYELDKSGKLRKADEAIEILVKQLNECKEANQVDSPVFQLIEGWSVSHNLTNDKTDAFRQQAKYENTVKDDLSEARDQGKEAVLKVFNQLEPLKEKAASVAIEVFLSFKAVKAWPEMIACHDAMDAPVQQIKMVREQLAFAYNRNNEHQKAEKIAQDIINKHGFDPETNGILGRVYKDLYFDFKKENNKLKAAVYLNQAIETYKKGFEADWRDAYPGINLLTLLALKGDEEMIKDYMPIVEFAVNRKIDAKETDYWDLATKSELCVIKRDYDGAKNHLTNALGLIPDNALWMLETTLNNFDLIYQTRVENQTSDDILLTIINDFKNSFLN